MFGKLQQQIHAGYDNLKRKITRKIVVYIDAVINAHKIIVAFYASQRLGLHITITARHKDELNGGSHSYIFEFLR